MSQFTYKAKKGPGELVHGRVDAESLDGAIAKVLALGYTPVDVKGKERKNTRHALKGGGHVISFGSRIPFSEILTFTRQISDLVDAGVPVLRALGIIKKQVKHPSFHSLVEKMYVVVEDGGALSAALAQFPETFSPFYVNIVKSGEIGGNLDVALSRLADFIEKDYESRAQVKASLIYPALIFVVGGLTIFVLFTWVIPRITVIFDDIGQTLPMITRVLLGMSDFLARFWWVLIISASLMGIYFQRLWNTEQGRLWIDSIKLKTPLLGDFIRDVDAGRFARTLGTLLENGVVIVTALEAVERIMENAVLSQELQEITREVANGKGLASAVNGSHFFSDIDVNMIMVGEESGQVYKGLYKLASYHENQSQRFMKTMTSMIEPVLILVLGAVVGFVVVGMLMPIFRMNLMIQ